MIQVSKDFHENWLFYWKAFDIILLLKDMDILKLFFQYII